MNILAIDIGNTNVVIAVFENNDIIDTVRVESDLKFWASFQKIKKYKVDGIIISSVVPKLNEIYVQACINLFQIEPAIISVKNAGVSTIVDKPVEIGADRLCNIAAAIEFYSTPAIVVDFGTATTYDVIDEKNKFIGGAIAPGIDVSARYLFESASLLRETAFTFPESAIAITTESNLQSGIMFGAVDEVDGMIHRIRSEMNVKKTAIILTGGFSTVIAPGLKTDHIIDKALTLKGMKLIYHRMENKL
ncbi:MAG: type III pantothenate kinase [Candidatus Marinimicrobia bacterium]|jgi:type III pantothenate kinase|nr:type III pantothenate kinase [Candidatus Neomarinimicrobiota bacterium]MBT3633235.1 type III pantothenate kinase [Candidatus Neomarinimicrobiota bacterium]MBT3682164.1 type III pantothenate kinase [Candidatus Neomarinimicrobiota bacterium]MBT3758835.1 type III pantothenate kinase [Candidatus Neomarinimicrobiota bacterium]MBT3895290.1 type III pantothenate kinase [Candidatus Neomarinimicrobiota bacterium]